MSLSSDGVRENGSIATDMITVIWCEGSCRREFTYLSRSQSKEGLCQAYTQGMPQNASLRRSTSFEASDYTLLRNIVPYFIAIFI